MVSAILGFFNRTASADPLADPRALAAWMSEQPTNDDLGLQERLIGLLEKMGAQQPRIGPSRVMAVMALDQQSVLIQARLLRQYLLPSLSDPVRQRLWHANDDLARWFGYTYETMCGALQETMFGGRSKGLAPSIAARMFHYRWVQAKLGVFRYENWTPGRWKTLHDLYAEAVRRDVAAVGHSPDAKAPADAGLSAGQEYVQILLLQRINTGNLTAPQVEIAAAWLRGCAHLLSLVPAPPEGNGFWLDPGLGDGLLVRKPRIGQAPLMYLDLAPLQNEIARGEVELMRMVTDASSTAQQADAAARLALLRRIDRLLRPDAKPVERRGERIETDRAVTVAVGLAAIAAALHSSRSDGRTDAASQKYRRGNPVELASAVADADPCPILEDDPQPVAHQGWRMYDSSQSGCCLISLSPDTVRLKLGMVLGIREDSDDRWHVGFVRRLKTLDGGRIEAGIEVIALQSLLISPRPIASRATGYSVDGIDVSLDGRGFDALYLPPGAGDGPRRSMLVPAGEYSERRRFFLSLGSAGYTVEFGAPLERAKEWVWTRFAVVSRPG